MTTGPAASVAAPSGRAFAKAIAIALVAAAVVLVTAVLPAEYGIDPLGSGRALGLLNLNTEADSAKPVTVKPASGGPLFPQDDGYVTDSRHFTLAPHTWMEFEYHLASQATMLYDWSAAADLEFDFHTEPAGQPPEAFESFEKGEVSRRHGAYLAPYDGVHGWYWRNNSDQEVTIALTAAGFFSGARLLHQGGAPEEIVLTGASR